MSVSGESMFARCIARMYRHRMKISGVIADLFVPAGVNPSLGNRNNAIQFPQSLSISYIPINLDHYECVVHASSKKNVVMERIKQLIHP